MLADPVGLQRCRIVLAGTLLIVLTGASGSAHAGGHVDAVIRTAVEAGPTQSGAQALRLPILENPLWGQHAPALAAGALLVAALPVVLWWRWQRRRRREHGYFDRIRDREERLKLALWASGEQFWDYDLGNGQMQRMRVSDDVRSASDIQVFTEVDTDHQIHRDDMPQVRDRLRRHVRGETPLFLSNTAFRVRTGAGSGCARAAAWWNAMPGAGCGASPVPRAT